MDGTEDDIIWEEEAANDGHSDMESNGDLLYPDLDKEVRAVFEESRKALTRISSGLAEKLHQTQTALFRATNPQEICIIPVMNPFSSFFS